VTLSTHSSPAIASSTSTGITCWEGAFRLVSNRHFASMALDPRGRSSAALRRHGYGPAWHPLVPRSIAGNTESEAPGWTGLQDDRHQSIVSHQIDAEARAPLALTHDSMHSKPFSPKRPERCGALGIRPWHWILGSISFTFYRPSFGWAAASSSAWSVQVPEQAAIRWRSRACSDADLHRHSGHAAGRSRHHLVWDLDGARED